MKLRFLFLGLVLVLTSRALSAQVDLKALDGYFAQAREDWQVPGFAVAIVKDGKVVLSKGYGILENGKPEPVDGNTVFAIASNTKAFIAAALGILADEGKLNWDDPVQKHLPYFELYDVYASQKTTIRDLLCHRVGLGTFSGDVIWYKSNYSAGEVVRRAKYVPQAYEYRAGYGYSNLMFIAAGEVIKAVSGKSWDDFIRERIFTPLGMVRTQTSVRSLPGMSNVASPHKSNQPIPYANWDNMGAAGGILSSVNDMAKWMQLQLSQGEYNGRQVFSPEVQEEFWQPHNNNRVSARAKEICPTRHFSAYGLGWGLFDWGGRFLASHSGGYDGMYSRVALVPEENMGIVVLTNSMTGIGTYLMYYTLDAFLSQPSKDWSAIGLEAEQRGNINRQARIDRRLQSRAEGTSPSLPPDQYAGTFQCPMYGDVEVRFQNGSLALHFPNAPELDARLSHWHYNTFKIEWINTHAWFDFGTVQFILDNNGAVQELQFDVPNDDIFFEEIRAVRKG